jgi:steroid delta-isomerase-like uncharacterized protein
MTRTEIESLVARCQEAFDQHDAVAVADEHSATCVMDSPTAGGVVTGREAIANVYAAWFNGFPDLVMVSEELLVDGARFAQRLTLTGTDTGGFLGLPATGKPFRLPLVWLCETRDGQIVHSRPVYDFSGLLIQIGALKAKLS